MQWVAYPICISSQTLFCLGKQCAPAQVVDPEGPSQSWQNSLPTPLALSCLPSTLAEGMAVWLSSDWWPRNIGFPAKWGRHWHSPLPLPFLPALPREVMPEDMPVILWPWSAVMSERPDQLQQCQPWHHWVTKTHASSLKLLSMSEKWIHLFYLSQDNFYITWSSMH